MAATKTASKARTTARKPKTAPKTGETVTDAQMAVQEPQEDTSTYVHPTRDPEFVSTGVVHLDRLTTNAKTNLMELATEGNTPQSRAYWTRKLAEYGITVPTPGN